MHWQFGIALQHRNWNQGRGTVGDTELLSWGGNIVTGDIYCVLGKSFPNLMAVESCTGLKGTLINSKLRGCGCASDLSAEAIFCRQSSDVAQRAACGELCIMQASKAGTIRPVCLMASLA